MVLCDFVLFGGWAMSNVIKKTYFCLNLPRSRFFISGLKRGRNFLLFFLYLALSAVFSFPVLSADMGSCGASGAHAKNPYKPEAEAVQDFAGCRSAPQMALPARPDEKALSFPGLQGLVGRWVARMPDALAEASFNGHIFEIVYSAKFEEGIRRYVRGYYSYDEESGVMSLKPAYKDMQNLPSVQGAVYQVLTLRNFEVLVRSDSGASFLYWTAHPVGTSSDQIFPLLAFTGVQENPYLVWERVK